MHDDLQHPGIREQGMGTLDLVRAKTESEESALWAGVYGSFPALRKYSVGATTMDSSMSMKPAGTARLGTKYARPTYAAIFNTCRQYVALNRRNNNFCRTLHQHTRRRTRDASRGGPVGTLPSPPCRSLDEMS